MKNPNFYYLKNLDIIENDLFEVNNAFDIYSLQKNKNKIFLCGSHEHKRNILTIFEFEKDNGECYEIIFWKYEDWNIDLV